MNSAAFLVQVENWRKLDNVRSSQNVMLKELGSDSLLEDHAVYSSVVFRRYQVQISAWRPAILTEIFIGFLKSICFACFHSIMKYGIFFCSNSPNSKTIFTLQKRTIRIIAGVKSRNSYRNVFMRLDIFTSSMQIYMYINELCCK
jgi:hypothetical protein